MLTGSRTSATRLTALARIAVLAVLSVGLLACGGRGGSPSSLPPIASSAVSPSPAAPVTTLSPVAPLTQRPASPRAAERAAVIAVVKRYYAIANNLRHDMNADALAALVTPKCVCQQQVRAIRQAAAKHEHYVDREHLNAVTPIVDTQSEARVLVDLNVSRGGLSTPSGRRITSVPAATHIHRLFGLRLVNGRWLIDTFEIA